MNEATTLMISMAKPSQLNCFFPMFFYCLSEDNKKPILNRYLCVKNRTEEEQTINLKRLKSNCEANQKKIP